MNNFKTIQSKLRQFITKYYTNELVKGVILFFAIGVLYFMLTLLIEYFLWLSPFARTILFWVFILVEVALFTKFIVIPLAKLFKFRKGINFEESSKLIGNHFPEVNDKLLNLLQLSKNKNQTDLLIASIEQKSEDLKPIPFNTAIDFTKSLKYLKYAAIPLLLFFVVYATGKINWFSDSYERVINYKTAYEPPAPFQFFVMNEKLQTYENKDFTIKIKTIGSVVPNQAQIKFNDQIHYLKQVKPGEFEYVFSQIKDDVSFTLSSNDVESKPYSLSIVNVPSLVGFDMVLDYPNYTKKKDEVLKSTGSATIPEGTTVSWKVYTKNTSKVSIYSKDTLKLYQVKPDVYLAKKQLFSNYNYSINTGNNYIEDYQNLSFSVNVLKDNNPELDVNIKVDSLDLQSLYFYGQANDDYGLSKLQLVYYPTDNVSDKTFVPISISKSNFSEFISAFPDRLEVIDGVSYDLYFEVFDNDVIHNYKSVKSNVFSYRKRTATEEENKQLNEQNETIKNISKTFDKLENQDKLLKELSKTQKEKEALSFNDKQKFQNFLKRQKEQEQMMKSFNKKLQKNIEEFQKENKNNKKDVFKEELKERLKENEEKLKRDEKLLEELEKMTEKINKEEFSQKLEELAKQNKSKKRSMQQLLELTKRFYVQKKQEKIQQDLEQLSKDQSQLANQTLSKNTKEKQKKLNDQFHDIQKQISELIDDNRKLRKPHDIFRDKLIENSVNKDQKEALENLKQLSENDNINNVVTKQKAAATKIKRLSELMKKAIEQGSSGKTPMEEDVEMLRQILDNLVLFSFDQEKLMNRFKTIDANSNTYSKLIIKQSTLKEHFEHVDDSLFSLSLRNPKISERINTQITNVFFNIEKSLANLTENRVYKGVSSQQYTISASNSLADLLSNMLDSMEQNLNMKPGEGEGETQLPDIIMSQEELNKKMEKALNKSKKNKPSKGSSNDGKNADHKKSSENNNLEQKSTNPKLQENKKSNQSKSANSSKNSQNQANRNGSDSPKNSETKLSPKPTNEDGKSNKSNASKSGSSESQQKVSQSDKKGNSKSSNKGKEGQKGQQGSKSSIQGKQDVKNGQKPGTNGNPSSPSDSGKPGQSGKSGKSNSSKKGSSNEKDQSQNKQSSNKSQGGDSRSSEQLTNSKPSNSNSKKGKSGSSGTENGSESDNSRTNEQQSKKSTNAKDSKHIESKQNEGYGEGGSEEMNEELYKIYQQQQKIRNALENKIQQNNTIENAGQLIRQMENIEMDLINKGFTQQTLQKMMDVQHQLLKLENATFIKEKQQKRESKTNLKSFKNNSNQSIENARKYFNTIEVLNRQALPLRNKYKKKLQDYFKNND